MIDLILSMIIDYVWFFVEPVIWAYNKLYAWSGHEPGVMAFFLTVMFCVIAKQIWEWHRD